MLTTVDQSHTDAFSAAIFFISITSSIYRQIISHDTISEDKQCTSSTSPWSPGQALGHWSLSTQPSSVHYLLQKEANQHVSIYMHGNSHWTLRQPDRVNKIHWQEDRSTATSASQLLLISDKWGLTFSRGSQTFHFLLQNSLGKFIRLYTEYKVPNTMAHIISTATRRAAVQAILHLLHGPCQTPWRTWGSCPTGNGCRMRSIGKCTHCIKVNNNGCAIIQRTTQLFCDRRV